MKIVKIQSQISRKLSIFEYNDTREKSLRISYLTKIYH